MSMEKYMNVALLFLIATLCEEVKLNSMVAEHICANAIIVPGAAHKQ